MGGSESGGTEAQQVRAFRLYYAATALFLIVDYGAGLNVRVAFLDGHPAARLGYYLVCFACLGIMLWRPSLTLLVATIESLAALVALILGFGPRGLLAADPDLALSPPVVTPAEILNFLLSGAVAYAAWQRGSRALARRLGRP